MGVKGLWKLLLPIGRRISIETLDHHKLAIDASIWLIQFIKANRDPITGKVTAAAHIIGFFKRICRLLYHHIDPIFIFDGIAPEIKRRTLLKRKELRQEFTHISDMTIQRTARKLIHETLLSLQLNKKQKEQNETKKLMIQNTHEEHEEEQQAPSGFVAGFNLGSSRSGAIGVSDGNNGLSDASTNNNNSNGGVIPQQQQQQVPTTTSTALDGVEGNIESTAANLDDDYTGNETFNTTTTTTTTSDWDLPLAVAAVEEAKELDAEEHQEQQQVDDDIDDSNNPIIHDDTDHPIEYEDFIQPNDRITNRNNSSNSNNKRQKTMHQINTKNFTVQDISKLPSIERKDAIEYIQRKQRITSRKQYIPVANDMIQFSNVQITNFLKSSHTNRTIIQLAQQATKHIDNHGHAGDIVASDYNTRIELIRDDDNINSKSSNISKNSKSKSKKDRTIESFRSLLSKRQNDDHDDNDNKDDNDISATTNMNQSPTSSTTIKSNQNIGYHSSHFHDDSNNNNNDDDDDELIDWEDNDTSIVKNNSNSELTAQEQQAIWDDAIISNHKINNNDNNDDNNNTCNVDTDLNSNQCKLVSKKRRRMIIDTDDDNENDHNDVVEIIDNPIPLNGVVLTGKNNEPTTLYQKNFNAHENDYNVLDDDKPGGFLLPDDTNSSPNTDTNQNNSTSNLQPDATTINEKITTNVADESEIVDENVDWEDGDDDDSNDTIDEKDEDRDFDEVTMSDPSIHLSNQLNSHLAQNNYFSNNYNIVSDSTAFTSQDNKKAEVSASTSNALIQAQATAEKLASWAGHAFRRAIKEANGDSHIPMSTSGENANKKLVVDQSNEKDDDTDVNEGQTAFVLESNNQNSIRRTNQKDNHDTEKLLSESNIASKSTTVKSSKEKSISWDDITLDTDFLEQNEAQWTAERNRRERDAETISDEMLVEIKQLLQLFGIPYIEAPAEAESQCVALERLGLVSGIVTEDSDAFVFGGRVIYKNIFEDQKYAEVYNIADAEREMNLSHNSMVALAMLLGGDYTEGVKGVGIVNAMEILDTFDVSHDLKSGLVSFRKWLDGFDPPLQVTDVAEGVDPEKAKISKFHSRHMSARTRWIVPQNFPADNVIKAYIDPVVDKSTDPFSWGGTWKANSLKLNWTA
jgi:DNA excision repair protein ERCC-5